MSKETAAVLKVKNITKNFGKTIALDNVSFKLEAGNILGLIGDNNAGKSTLLKILSGNVKPSSGSIYLNGEEVNINNPADAMQKGIAMVHEFLQLVGNASIWENFFMGREITTGKGKLGLLDIGKMRSIAKEVIHGYGHNFDIEGEVGNLSGGQKQIVAVTRSMNANPRILLLDEPTHGLSQRVINDIFAIIKDAKEKRGIAVIISGQWFEQVSDFVDKVIVLRRGKIMGQFNAESASGAEIFKLAIGLKS